MEKIVEKAISKIQELEDNVPEGKHIITGDIRKLSSKLYKEINDKSLENILLLCEELLEQRKWALGVIAYDFAYRIKSQYSDYTYDIFFHWLKDYVKGWGDCDDFCTHAFGELLRQNKSLFERIITWTEDGDFWVRRASAVILIPAILKDDYDGINPFEITNRLMNDEHDLVLKGYGWMLKAFSQVDRISVEKYLIENYKKMPRVAYRYALEKFDKEVRNKLMKMK